MCPDTDTHCIQLFRTSKESGTTPYHCWSLVPSQTISLNISLPCMMIQHIFENTRCLNSWCPLLGLWVRLPPAAAWTLPASSGQPPQRPALPGVPGSSPEPTSADELSLWNVQELIDYLLVFKHNLRVLHVLSIQSWE